VKTVQKILTGYRINYLHKILVNVFLIHLWYWQLLVLMWAFARAGYVENIIFSVIDKDEKLFVVYFLRMVINII
jgi:hypothetical protein